MRKPGPLFLLRLTAVWIAVSLGGIIVGGILWQRLERSMATTIRNSQLRHQAEVVSLLLTNEESSQRGYLLTQDEEYLAPFRRADAAFDAEFDRLARLAFDNDDLRRDVIELRGLTEVQRTEMRRAIAARTRGSLDDALKVVQTGEGRENMEQIGNIVRRMNRSPNDLFRTGIADTRQSIRQALVFTLAASVMGLGAGLLAFHLARMASKQEHAGRRLAAQAATASRAVEERSAFLANMSHEIRTPMNAILGFSELLISELPAGGRSASHARSVRESANSLLQLINDILDLSKIEAGMVSLVPEPTDLEEIAAFLQTAFAQQASAKNLTMGFQLEEGLPATLLLDRTHLRQILVNLLGNAIKYTERGEIRVRFSWAVDRDKRDRGTLFVEVLDTGVGISVHKVQQIFQPFVQLDATRGAASPGPGLGLSLVKRLVQAMKGEISVESVFDRGSIFRLEFPNVTISSRLAPEPADESAGDVNFNAFLPADLLVVDDNALNRELLAGYFKDTHHSLVFAADGFEAIESVRRNRPDLVLMDIRMPRMDGRRALEEIHKLPGAEILPVIAVTASSMLNDEYLLRGLFAGFVRKPFSRETLFRELSGFFRKVPRIAFSAGAEPGEAELFAKSPAVPPDTRWAALVEELLEIEAGPWLMIRANGAINETKNFARQLAEMGAAAECSPLVNYAKSLIDDADIYAVTSLAARINEFPSVVRSLAGEIPVPAHS